MYVPFQDNPTVADLCAPMPGLGFFLGYPLLE